MITKRTARIIRFLPLVPLAFAIALSSSSYGLRHEFPLGEIHVTLYQLIQASLIVAIVANVVALYFDLRSGSGQPPDSR